MSSLAILSPHSEKLLGPSAVAVFKVLHEGWVRNEGNFFRPLKLICERTGLAYRTCKRALKRLRDAGMIRTLRMKSRVWGTKSDGWDGQEGLLINRYIVKAVYRDGNICVDREDFSDWVRKRTGKRVEEPPGRWSHHGTRAKKDGAPSHMRGPLIKFNLIFSGFSFFQKEKQQRIVDASRCSRFSLSAKVKMAKNKKPKRPPDSDSDAGVIAEIPDLLATASRREPTEQPPVLPAIARPKTVRQSHDIIPRHITSEFQRVRWLVESYKSAISTVYGKKTYAFSNGDIRKFKGYKALVTASAELVKHEISPEGWAEWSLTNLRKKRWKHKTPPITMVFAAKSISKYRGWFRNTYEPKSRTVELELENYEQVFRRREAKARWKGVPRNPLVGLPIWYVKLREQEIAEGITDPLELYPKLKDHARR